MPVEITGIISHKLSSEEQALPPKVFDKPLMCQYARAHERSGYDRVLIAQSSFWPDSMPLASYLAAVTDRLSFMVAHRPGFVTPTMAARQFATLDQLSEGRAGIHIITAANDLETQCDGDFLTKEQRYRRSREFVQVLRAIWGSDDPVNHEGEFFRFNNGASELKPFNRKAVPVYWAGSSDLAVRFAGECADVYAFGLESIDKMKPMMERVRGYATAAGREIAFQGTCRVILGKTESEAWDNANTILKKVVANSEERLRLTGVATMLAGGRTDPKLSNSRNSAGQARFKTLTEGESILDDRLWVGPIKSGIQMSTSLVGTPEQVADAMMRYYRLGITGFLIRGFDLLADAIDHGRELIPRLRAKVAEYDNRVLVTDNQRG